MIWKTRRKLYLKLHNLFMAIANYFFEKALQPRKGSVYHETDTKTKKVTKRTTRSNSKKSQKKGKKKRKEKK